VNTYLNLFKLIEVFPSIILSGFAAAKLNKNRKGIRETKKIDTELHSLLTTPFPGIKANVD
jgi:hypothetical protein